MAITVYIGNNIWNFLFERKLDLAIQLPLDDYSLFMTREAEFEIPPDAFGRCLVAQPTTPIGIR